MSATSAVNYHESTVKGISLLRHVKPGTLACVLLVALAVLSTTRGREPQSNEFAYAGGAEPHLAISPCDKSVAPWQETHAHKFHAKKLVE
jgi:hypothetical protein